MVSKQQRIEKRVIVKIYSYILAQLNALNITQISVK